MASNVFFAWALKQSSVNILYDIHSSKYKKILVLLRDLLLHCYEQSGCVQMITESSMKSLLGTGAKKHCKEGNKERGIINYELSFASFLCIMLDNAIVLRLWGNSRLSMWILQSENKMDAVKFQAEHYLNLL